MIILVRTDLKNTEGHKIRSGKIAAQVAHASMAWLTREMIIESVPVWNQELDDGFGEYETIYYSVGRSFSEAEKDWLENSFTKICLAVPSLDELLAIDCAALEAGITSHIITDNGTTEFGGVPTITTCALGPDYSSKLDPLISHLRLL
jgi:peptidyl-tRNA hydrolase